MSASTSSSSTSVDALFDGALTLEQGVRGYRYNVDSVLLCVFAHSVLGEDILDVGAGVGTIGLGAAHLCSTRRVTLVERQPRLAALARANVQRNALSERCTVIETDIRTLKGRSHHYDGAVMNPPYFRAGAGKLSPENERALARHEVFGTIEELVSSTARHLYKNAPLCVVFPADRAGALFAALDRSQRRHIVLQTVLPYAGAAATLVLVAARGSSTHTTHILPPLILHQEDRSYTAEAAHILRHGHWPWHEVLPT